jgi:multiple sugar transport system permease protein
MIKSVLPRGMSMKRRETIQGYLFLVPSFLLILFVIGYPLVNSFQLSLTEFKLNRGIDSAHFCGLCNFSALLKDPNLGIYLRNQGIWVAGVTILPLVVGLLLALLMNQKLHWIRLWRALLIIPWMMPAATAIFSWRWILDRQWGLINYYLKQLGLITTNVGLLADPHWLWPTILVVAVWLWYPYNYVMLLASLQGIPVELYEVGKIDGTNGWTAFWYITLPSIKPVLYVLLLLGLIWSMNDFSTIMLLTSGGPGIDSTTLAPLVYRVSFRYFDLGQGAAIGVVLMLMSTFFSIFYLLRKTEDPH